MRYTFLLILFFLFSCKQSPKNQEKSNKTIDNATGISSHLYEKLIDYQKQFPIEKIGRKGGLYIYEVLFYKQKQDTFIQLSVSPDGYIVDTNELVLGVYTGKNLYPTIVKDSKEHYSENFVASNLGDTALLRRYRRILGKDYPEVFPPLYKYEVRHGNMFLSSVDSVWLKW